MNPRGLTVLMCNVGSGVNVMSGYSVYTRYVLLILSHFIGTGMTM